MGCAQLLLQRCQLWYNIVVLNLWIQMSPSLDYSPSAVLFSLSQSSNLNTQLSKGTNRHIHSNCGSVVLARKGAHPKQWTAARICEGHEHLFTAKCWHDFPLPHIKPVKEQDCEWLEWNAATNTVSLRVCIANRIFWFEMAISGLQWQRKLAREFRIP